MQQNKETKNNLKVIFIGFILIIFVIGIFFLKIRLFNKEDEDNLNNLENIQKQENVSDYKSITASDLFKKKNEIDFGEIIDIRSPEYFDQEHILGAKNIPMDSFASVLAILEKEKNYFIVDDFGFTPNEIQILKVMTENGFENIFYLEGGISAWKNELYPMISFGDPNSFTDQSKVTYLTSEELQKIISEESYLFIVDLRTKNEFEAGHIETAVNIPLDSLERRRNEIPFGKKIILYDNTGILAFQGAVRLFDMGTFNVYALSDGFNAYSRN